MAKPVTTAKLFRNGASQAVRLPAEFRFEGSEVRIRRDQATGNVILSQVPTRKMWEDFFALRDSIDIPEDFMATRPCNTMPVDRHLFDDEIESANLNRPSPRTKLKPKPVASVVGKSVRPKALRK